MVEKIGHIKNPLTVIAIFAALAEVSGTVVLPFLDKETQHVYVWFLMFFPILLVAIFFFVLYKKHHVLYAPTDFKDDKTFTDLFENATSSAKVAKINSEQEDPIADTTTGTQEAQVQPIVAPGPSISAAETLRRSFQGNGLLAEELVIAKLAKDLGLKFDRNLAVKGQPRLVFDAVSTSSDRAVVAEVRFTRQGMFPDQMLSEYFERVKRFSETLPDELKNKIEFIFALATDTDEEARLKRMDRTIEKIRTYSEAYQFKTVVRLFKMQDLEREFSVQ
ncbi:hypothetical protein [Polaromonas sp. AET17H-212]|uniref:hypothetical protein n=1 Tax=Polaromonas sp. AET17H-212 TaxID=1977061 RepID=UPI000BBBE15B|nr:hypothetical protein [Polaromonas sp. AET17H-212]